MVQMHAFKSWRKSFALKSLTKTRIPILIIKIWVNSQGNYSI